MLLLLWPSLVCSSVRLFVCSSVHVDIGADADPAPDPEAGVGVGVGVGVGRLLAPVDRSPAAAATRSTNPAAPASGTFWLRVTTSEASTVLAVDVECTQMTPFRPTHTSNGKWRPNALSTSLRLESSRFAWCSGTCTVVPPASSPNTLSPVTQSFLGPLTTSQDRTGDRSRSTLETRA